MSVDLSLDNKRLLSLCLFDINLQGKLRTLNPIFNMFLNKHSKDFKTCSAKHQLFICRFRQKLQSKFPQMSNKYKRSICKLIFFKCTASHWFFSSPCSANRAERGTDFWDLTRLVDQGLLPSDRGRTLKTHKERWNRTYCHFVVIIKIIKQQNWLWDIHSKELIT